MRVGQYLERVAPLNKLLKPNGPITSASLSPNPPARQPAPPPRVPSPASQSTSLSTPAARGGADALQGENISSAACFSHRGAHMPKLLTLSAAHRPPSAPPPQTAAQAPAIWTRQATPPKNLPALHYRLRVVFHFISRLPLPLLAAAHHASPRGKIRYSCDAAGAPCAPPPRAYGLPPPVSSAFIRASSITLSAARFAARPASRPFDSASATRPIGLRLRLRGALIRRRFNLCAYLCSLVSPRATSGICILRLSSPPPPSAAHHFHLLHLLLRGVFKLVAEILRHPQLHIRRLRMRQTPPLLQIMFLRRGQKRLQLVPPPPHRQSYYEAPAYLSCNPPSGQALPCLPSAFTPFLAKSNRRKKAPHPHTVSIPSPSQRGRDM